MCQIRDIKKVKSGGSKWSNTKTAIVGIWTGPIKNVKSGVSPRCINSTGPEENQR